MPDSGHWKWRHQTLVVVDHLNSIAFVHPNGFCNQNSKCRSLPIEIKQSSTLIKNQTENFIKSKQMKFWVPTYGALRHPEMIPLYSQKRQVASLTIVWMDHRRFCSKQSLFRITGWALEDLKQVIQVTVCNDQNIISALAQLINNQSNYI